MNFLKKKLLLTILFVFSVSAIFAMPGFSSFIKDSSGEFVYYRDKSFPEETYIGILYYDDENIQVRFYQPMNKEKFVPEKEISILFSINPDAPYFELTGELIMSTILPESNDLDIVNYLHDILYEFSARRIKEGDVLPEKNAFSAGSDFITTGTKSFQTYEQFGGGVTIIFDPLIPIFNIKSILNDKNEPILSCVTFGILQNSADSTFDQFPGLSDSKTESNKSRKTTINKNSKVNNYSTNDGQFISLDNNWSQAMDNLWLCGNESLLTMNTIPAMPQNSENYELTVIRKLLQSAAGSYTDLSDIEITENKEKNQFVITQNSFQPKTANKIINKKILTKNNSTKGFYYFALTIFDEFYTQNASYYNKIIKSYKIKN